MVYLKHVIVEMYDSRLEPFIVDIMQTAILVY